jgi:hypothetical protein
MPGDLHRFVADRATGSKTSPRSEETTLQHFRLPEDCRPGHRRPAADAQAAFAKAMVNPLDTEGVALDIGAYRDAPAGSCGSGAAPPSRLPISRR